MKSCSFLLPSLPRPPHREWVEISAIALYHRSITLRSFNAHIFVSERSMEGGTTESDSIEANQKKSSVNITANAVSLKTAVAMNTGAKVVSSFNFLRRPLHPGPVCSRRFALPKVKWDSAPDFPIIRTELNRELALDQVNLPVLRQITRTNMSCSEDSYWLSEDVIRVDNFFISGPWTKMVATFTVRTMMVLRIAVK